MDEDTFILLFYFKPKFLGKAGWVKKATGRLLVSYKDRYIHVERTEIVVYENEDLQNCLERVDLENYDKCHELKSPFKKKHRLILIRSAKSGNKGHDVKLQAQTAEEKEAWIKALTDGINRAKNKVFDEVKVDESSNLEHVTRSRPKGNRNRRPPTRIHMKEVCANTEKSPDPKKKTGPPPTPPNKPSSSCSTSNLAEASQSRPNSHPPTPPSKENKPSNPAVDPDQEGQGAADEKKEKEENSRKETTGTAVEIDEADHSISKEDVPTVRGDESSSTEAQGPKEESEDTMSSPCPPETQHTEDNPAISQPIERQECTTSDTSDSSLQEEDAPPKSEVSSVAVSVNDPLSDSISLSPLGSHAGLDVLDTSEDNIQISVSLRPTQATSKPQVGSKAFPSPQSKPITPLKPSTKAKSASIGDLLSESSVCAQVRQHPRAVAVCGRSPTDDVIKLETEVALEREKTGELLSRVSQSQGGGDREGTPEDLLAKALEKLEKADLVLREVKKLKLAKNSRDRKSW
uniref:Pleckstrin homology domain containing, family O member 2 n=1 Tax=Seriola dumerili TaxID=41447 RepID=A0A3B4UIC8_SERDU